MIIWVIWWLFDWLFDDYLWLFVWILDYLMIIWWLFLIIFWILDYLMLIWCLFDDYSNYLMIFCHFVAPQPVGSLRLDGWELTEKRPCRGICCSGSLPCSFLSCDHLVIMLGLPTLWATNYLQARLWWRGQYRVINRTWRLRLPRLGLFCGGTIRLIQVMNSNQRLGRTLRSCLLPKACCGSYRQKWENGQP